MTDLYKKHCEAFYPEIECAPHAFMSNLIWTIKIPIRGVTPIIHILRKARFLSILEFYRLFSERIHEGVVPTFQSYNHTHIFVGIYWVHLLRSIHGLPSDQVVHDKLLNFTSL